jgi:hypothetical protein
MGTSQKIQTRNRRLIVRVKMPILFLSSVADPDPVPDPQET